MNTLQEDLSRIIKVPKLDFVRTGFSERLVLTAENVCNNFGMQLYTDWDEHVTKVSNPFYKINWPLMPSAFG